MLLLLLGVGLSSTRPLGLLGFQLLFQTVDSLLKFAGRLLLPLNFALSPLPSFLELFDLFLLLEPHSLMGLKLEIQAMNPYFESLVVCRKGTVDLGLVLLLIGVYLE